MTTYDLLFDTPPSRKHTLAAPFRPLRRMWDRLRHARAERRLAVTLASLDEHLLRDIGVEPIDVIDALKGRPGPSILFNPMRRRADHE